MTPEQYAIFKIQLQQTQRKGEQTLARISKTLEGVQETIKQIQQNDDNIQKFKKAFGDVMVKLAEKIAGSMVNPFKKIQGKHYDDLPIEITVEELVKCMMKHKNILIITGAGVSAPSGIPTFRGTGGLYSKKFEWEGKEYEPEEFITKQFYDQHPKPIWNWIQQIYKMTLICKPNKIHQNIDKLAEVLNARGKIVTVVTQNIDDLHLKPKNKAYEYYCVHGNVKFVRCSNNHLSSYASVRSQIQQNGGAACSKCGEPIRPHVLFFDESYGPQYGEEVKDKTFPFVFVIGSSLSTGLCAKLTLRGDQVVEINPEPVIEIGRVYQFKRQSAGVLTEILNNLGETKQKK